MESTHQRHPWHARDLWIAEPKGFSSDAPRSDSCRSSWAELSMSITGPSVGLSPFGDSLEQFGLAKWTLWRGWMQQLHGSCSGKSRGRVLGAPAKKEEEKHTHVATSPGFPRHGSLNRIPKHPPLTIPFPRHFWGKPLKRFDVSTTKWVWVKNWYLKWNPSEWKQGLKPAVPWWLNFDPYPKWGEFTHGHLGRSPWNIDQHPFQFSYQTGSPNPILRSRYSNRRGGFLPSVAKDTSLGFLARLGDETS